VRTVEHGNLIDDAAARLMAENGMFLVANLVTYYAMKDRAAKFGMTAEKPREETRSSSKVASDRSRSAKRHGVPVAYGSDLLGELHWTRAASSPCGARWFPDRDHPLGDDDRGANPAPRGQGRHVGARRLRRSVVVDGDP